MDNIEDIMATIWEFLSGKSEDVSSDDIRMETGIPLPQIYIVLNKMDQVDLLEKADKKQNAWKSKKRLDTILYARAVEIGIPLLSLENTIDLSLDDKKDAERIIYNGIIDKEKQERVENKIKHRQNVLRGRAASQAATTDLAKIIQDTQEALSKESNPSLVQYEILREAVKTLEILIDALEKK